MPLKFVLPALLDATFARAGPGACRGVGNSAPSFRLCA